MMHSVVRNIFRGMRLDLESKFSKGILLPKFINNIIRVLNLPTLILTKH